MDAIEKFIEQNSVPLPKQITPEECLEKFEVHCWDVRLKVPNQYTKKTRTCYLCGTTETFKDVAPQKVLNKWV